VIRALLPALLLAGPVAAAGLDLNEDQRAAFRQEVRAALLADPGPVARALDIEAPDLYAEEAQQDLDRIDDLATLFAPTPRGIGSETPRLTIVFFETYPCAACDMAWAELEALVARHPDLRVEPRFAESSGAAQLLLSLLDHQGAGAYHAARAEMLAAGDEEGLRALLETRGWVQDRMLRPAPQAEAEAFRRLEFTETPAYVFPRMMLQGAIPGVVLEKYVTD